MFLPLDHYHARNRKTTPGYPPYNVGCTSSTIEMEDKGVAGRVPGLSQEMSPKKSGGTPSERPVGIQGRRFLTNATIP